MDVKNLSWEQIKELAEMAMKTGSDFSLTLCADGDCSLDISKHDYPAIVLNDGISKGPSIMNETLC